MATFKGDGIEWDVKVNVAIIKNVREECDGLDLSKLTEDSLQTLMSDPVILCDTLFIVCHKQAKEKDVTDEQFGTMLGGDVLSDATMALEDALIEFQPNGRQREIMANMACRVRKMQARVIDRAAEKLQEMIDSPKIEAELNARVDRHLKQARFLSLPDTPDGLAEDTEPEKDVEETKEEEAPTQEG